MVKPVGVVVGNPKPNSRTRAVAEAVAEAAARATGLTGSERVAVDLAEFAPLLFDWSSVRVRALVDAICGCSLVVVASPTFKASYTGLLKAFLDWFSSTDLQNVTAVPVMVGAGLHHALAVEVHLRPVLVELGATLPTRGLYVTEAELDQVDDVIGRWLEGAAPALRAAVHAGS
ncbi:MAG TPA: NAD(P)H-dependent oxidoreductase [Acidimicrobiales bacterium]|nr:NAD(P)H-dependent oxidoreductase [Acidimicrobiales bacterium]